jgi:hypothetical protein
LFRGLPEPRLGTFAASSDLFGQWKFQQAGSMAGNGSKDGDHLEPTARGPVVVASAVAILGLLGMLIVDHGPWNRPKVRTAEVPNYTTTGEAARAAGAAVTPTGPGARIEPTAPGPKPAEPANPVTP